MNRSFIKILTTGAIAFTVLTIVSIIAIATQSSIGLLRGVNTLPSGTAFVPRQAPAMVSLLANPEKLYSIRQVTLPLKNRKSDRQEWQQWSRDNLNKLGLDYQQIKPWLGNELTWAITALDYDRNSDNGVQPGYLIAAEIKNTQLATESLENLYSQDRSVLYKGANIITYSPQARGSNIRSYAIVGDFVLFANHPQIIREAINQAQAVNLNLQHSDDYRKAIATPAEGIANITQPHIAIAYIDVPKTLAWSNKLGVVEPEEKDVNRTLSAFLSIADKDLVAHTALTNSGDSQNSLEVFRLLLKNSELERVFEYLFLPGDGSTYVDLTAKTPTSTQIYEVAKLAIKGLFPHLDAIAIKDRGSKNNISRTEILFKLDT